jgi:transcription elongation factor Elf1
MNACARCGHEEVVATHGNTALLICPVCDVKSPQPRKGGEGQQGGEHYKVKIDPWELQRTMQTSGNAFVDARRADAIKYAWRNKEGKMLEDLRKARHCLDAAIQELENPKPEWASSPSFASVEAIVKLHPHEPKQPSF